MNQIHRLKIEFLKEKAEYRRKIAVEKAKESVIRKFSKRERRRISIRPKSLQVQAKEWKDKPKVKKQPKTLSVDVSLRKEIQNEIFFAN